MSEHFRFEPADFGWVVLENYRNSGEVHAYPLNGWAYTYDSSDALTWKVLPVTYGLDWDWQDDGPRWDSVVYCPELARDLQASIRNGRAYIPANDPDGMGYSRNSLTLTYDQLAGYDL